MLILSTLVEPNVLDGLDYHYKNFLDLHRKKPFDERGVKHEISAYLCRIGQFYYFLKGTCRVEDEDFSNDFRVIDELCYFRHKYSAHRSLDSPKEESASDRFHIDSIFGIVSGVRITPLLRADEYFSITYGDGKRDRTIDIKNQHPKVLKEIDSFFNKFFLSIFEQKT